MLICSCMCLFQSIVASTYLILESEVTIVYDCMVGCIQLFHIKGMQTFRALVKVCLKPQAEVEGAPAILHSTPGAKRDASKDIRFGPSFVTSQILHNMRHVLRVGNPYTCFPTCADNRNHCSDYLQSIVYIAQLQQQGATKSTSDYAKALVGIPHPSSCC